MRDKAIDELLRRQRIAARKSIATKKQQLAGLKSEARLSVLNAIERERQFFDAALWKNTHNLDIDGVMKIIHTRHRPLSLQSSYNNCRECKKVLAEMPINLPGAPAENKTTNPDGDVKPMFGSLLAVLENEVNEERQRLDRMRVPSQNDLTRWALKDAVLEFYRNMNLPENTQIVETAFDDRLLPKLAPDFDIIYQMWNQRLYDLTRRNDKYTLQSDEFDKAEKDLEEGMRGSAFEKQLDRYREEFMQKLKR